MTKWIHVTCAALMMTTATARTASADWLLTGFVSSILNVSTAPNTEFAIPAEKFDSSVGFGVNLASAFPDRGNLGFEVDLGVYPEAMKTSDVYGDALASSLIAINTNFFYSPAVPRVRPYFSVGPTFSYRSDRDEAEFAIPSGWAIGMNAGAGVMLFANQRFGGRIDARYVRNFGDYYDLREDAVIRQSGFRNLSFFRLFFGATVVL